MASILETWTNVEVRSVIRFLNAKGNNPTAIHNQLMSVYGPNVMSRKQVSIWCRYFMEGRTVLEDRPRFGRPPSIVNPEVIRYIERLILADRKTTIRYIAEVVNVSKSLVHEIITERLCCRRFNGGWCFPNELPGTYLNYGSVRVKSASFAAQKINQVYSANPISLKTAQKWYRRFIDGQSNANNNRRSVRSVKFDNDLLKNLINSEPELTVGQIAVRLNSSHETVFRHLKEIENMSNLGNKNNKRKNNLLSVPTTSSGSEDRNIDDDDCVIVPIKKIPEDSDVITIEDVKIKLDPCHNKESSHLSNSKKILINNNDDVITVENVNVKQDPCDSKIVINPLHFSNNKLDRVKIETCSVKVESNEPHSAPIVQNSDALRKNDTEIKTEPPAY